MGSQLVSKKIEIVDSEANIWSFKCDGYSRICLYNQVGNIQMQTTDSIIYPMRDEDNINSLS